MRDAYAKGHIVLAMGDFNMVPLSLAHKIVETHGCARDVWRIIHPDSSIGAAQDDVEKARGKPMPSADFNLQTNGATCDSVLNTWLGSASGSGPALCTSPHLSKNSPHDAGQNLSPCFQNVQSVRESISA